MFNKAYVIIPMKSIKKTYLIALAGTLIPSWIGDALLTSTQTDNIDDPLAILAYLFFIIAIWGTSMGFFYLGKTTYAILSGLGKCLIIFGGIGIFYLTGSIGHPYIIFIGLALSMIWGMIDFPMLYYVAKDINTKHSHNSS